VTQDSTLGAGSLAGGSALLSGEAAKNLVRGAKIHLDLARSELKLEAARSGLGVVHRYSRAVDEIIISLWGAVGRAAAERGWKPFERIALVAQGGYGRSELNLYSDVDLLAVVPERLRAEEEISLRRFLHLLWDLGLELGHAARSVEECVRTLGTDIDSATALIEARFLAGNREIYDAMRERFNRRLRSEQQKWFLEFKRRDWEERHQRYGSSVYLLEPNVKEGEGGLRDIHTVRWLAYVLYGESSLETLERHGKITAAERATVLQGADFLFRIRNQLHLNEGRKSDVLLFEKQPEIARSLGYTGDDTSLAEERFMRDYYVKAREIFHITARVVEELAAPPSRTARSKTTERALGDRLVRRNGFLYVTGDEAAYFRDDPVRFVEVFAKAAAETCRVSHATKRTIERLLAEDDAADLSDNERARNAFLSILRSPGDVGAVLRDMHECGVLELCIPEFRRIFCMVRADLYHKYTVDEHSLRAVETADRVRAGDSAVPELLRRESKLVRRWDLLYLAILIHDIGKGEGHGHVRRGAQIAQHIASRLRLSAEETETVRRLVLDHLKLSHTALRRDIEDPMVVGRVADSVGDIEYLRMLYVLTYCDLCAVSPESWTEWKSVLLAELYTRTASVLAGSKEPPRRIGPSPEEIIAQVRERLTYPEEEHAIPLEEYLAELPERYLATTPPELVAHHYEMLDALDEENRVFWELRNVPGMEYSEITVAAYDQPGLFSVLCGAFASKGINILGAQIFSTKGGFVIDRFQVQDVRGEPLPEGFVLERLRNDVNRILRGKKRIEDLFAKAPRRAVATRSDVHLFAPPDVVVDNESSKCSTIIEVKTYDRLGLLYDVTRVFTRHNLDIELARITTEAYRVVDVFYVTDSENNKIDDPAEIERLRAELLEVISK